ncbi:(2Fe-2S)-binding protein [Candidatus Peregrinibacteria bacterium]|jgi:NAD(P)H-nitrite reductase large subunit|nr:(2Fe-2S)-binding protein [Candidatus Peregrinibacteria bacterium]
MSNNDDVICHCTNVNEGTIVKAIKDGKKTLSEIQSTTSACTTCQSCMGDIENLIDIHGGE